MMKRFFLLSMVLLLVGCATKINTVVTMPAKHADVVKYNSVAVVTFDHNKANDYTLEFESIILNAQANGQKVYKVVDRSNIDKIIKEHSFQMNMADPDTIVEMGRLLAIDAIWTGSINGTQDQRRYQEKRTKCENNKCREYNVSCVNKSFSINVVPKLTAVSTGKVIYSKSFTEVASVDECVDESVTTPFATLQKRALNKVLEKFKQDIAPYEVSVSLEIMKDTKGIEDDNSKTIFKDSIKLVSDGKVDMACQILETVYKKYQQVPSVAYNYSLCLETRGEYQASIDILEPLITGPYPLSSSQRTLIYNAIDRNKQNIVNRDALEAQTKN